MADDQDATELDYITPDTGLPASEGEAEPRTETEEADDQSADVDNDEETLEADAEGDENDETGEDSESDDDQTEELEVSGKKYKVHKDLKPLMMMQADYTRKTQEVAEVRRSIEAEKTAIEQQKAFIEQQRQLQQQNLQGYAQLVTIDQQLADYERVDWDKWENEDFISAQSAYRKFQALKNRRQEVAGNLQRAEHQARQQAEYAARQHQAEIAKKREDAARETLRVLQKDIKGWDEKLAGKVSNYARQIGYTDEELFNATGDPRAFKVLHKAMQFEELKAKQKAAQTPKPEQPKPLTQVTKGRTGPAKAGLDDRLSAEEWVRRRNEQLRQGA